MRHLAELQQYALRAAAFLKRRRPDLAHLKAKLVKTAGFPHLSAPEVHAVAEKCRGTPTAAGDERQD